MKRMIYVYDAICGWCFGFSPVMKAVAAQYPDTPVEVISGGLMLGDRVGTIEKVAPFIKTGYRDVEHRAGVKFGEAFIENMWNGDSFILNSLPPAKALAIFREEYPNQQLRFAHALHDMIYVEGCSPDDHNALANVASSFGYDHQLFLTKLDLEEYEDLAKRDFMYAQQLQVTGYPGLIVETNDNQLYLMAKGYTPEKLLTERLQKLVATA